MLTRLAELAERTIFNVLYQMRALIFYIDEFNTMKIVLLLVIDLILSLLHYHSNILTNFNLNIDKHLSIFEENNLSTSTWRTARLSRWSHTHGGTTNIEDYYNGAGMIGKRSL